MMKSRTIAAAGLAALLAGCTMSIKKPDELPAARARRERAEAAAAGELAALEPVSDHGVVPASAARPRRPLPADELEIWNDPGFKRRFIESFIAETEVEPRVTELEREEMLLVFDRISADDVTGAIEILEDNRVEGASAVFDFTLGSLRYREERFEDAAGAYGVAVDKVPRFRRAWRALGLLRAQLGEYERALEALTRVIELGGGDGDSYGLLGFAYLNTEDYLAAESAYRMAILLDPRTTDWKVGLAQSLFKQERYADASASCRTLIQADPNRAELWLLQANAFLGMGEPKRAAENLELVDSLGGSTTASLALLGDIYVGQELFELAGDAYVRSLEAADDGAGIVERALRAAGILAARGALTETSLVLDRLQLERGDPLSAEDTVALLRLRARVALAKGGGEAEARILEEIVRLDPLDGEALLMLGRYRHQIGATEEAIFFYERAAALDAFEARAKRGQAQVLVANRRYDEALPLLARAAELEPGPDLTRYTEHVARLAKR
jgi:tetratricopeptide (TPR) repeat protein